MPEVAEEEPLRLVVLAVLAVLAAVVTVELAAIPAAMA
jgi:hypothetical protein